MSVSRTSSVVITSIIFTVISLLSVAARLVSRFGVLKNGGRDEVAVVVAMVSDWNFNLVGCVETSLI